MLRAVTIDWALAQENLMVGMAIDFATCRFVLGPWLMLSD